MQGSCILILSQSTYPSTLPNLPRSAHAALLVPHPHTSLTIVTTHTVIPTSISPHPRNRSKVTFVRHDSFDAYWQAVGGNTSVLTSPYQ